MDTCWTFRVFKDAGVNVIEEWLTSLPAGIEERVRVLLIHMANEQTWGGHYFKKLTGYDNLYEIRITGKVQYRLLGCYGPGRRVFSLLLGTTKGGASRGKSATYDPKNALEIADTRSKIALENGRYTDEYDG
jgi:hypothetical protein